MQLFGRKQIFSDADEVTAGNILRVLGNAYAQHLVNRGQIRYLFGYYRGKQPILDRVKTVRPEICNRVVVNLANEIVAFKAGYLCGEPIQYVGLDGKEATTEAVKKLNRMMTFEGKSAQDLRLITDMMVCGTAYRMVLPDQVSDGVPFELFTLEPENTFVVYHSGVGHRPLLGVYYTFDENGTETFTAYTATQVFTVRNGKLLGVEGHILGAIPIIEYPAADRLGAFETVLPLLDAINTAESNRLDGVEQFVQSLMKFKNCDIDDKDIGKIAQLGAVKIKSNGTMDADVELMTQELNQDQTQTLMGDLYQLVLNICGMPNRNGGSSTSDTGQAVVYRDGWSDAEVRAKITEGCYKESDPAFVQIVLRICRMKGHFSLDPWDIEPHFTRRNYENIQSKSQVLLTMLSSDKIHPLDAYKGCGMFCDPEQAYQNGMEWYAEQQEQAAQAALNTVREDDKTQNAERTAEKTQEA